MFLTRVCVLMRFVVRPSKFLTSPARIARAFSALPKKVTPTRVFDWQQDFFLELPPPELIKNKPLCYYSLYNFSKNNKLNHRHWFFNNGFPIPETKGINLEPCDGTFIVRPLRHFQGRNYRITSDPCAYNPSYEYISRVFPKKWEYRVLVSRGKCLVTLFKKVPQSLQEQPQLAWNHSCGSTFVTVLDPLNDRLRHTDLYEKIESNPLLTTFDLVAIDVLVNKEPHQPFSYVICELNFAPALSLNSNIEKLVAHVNQNPRTTYSR